MVQFAVAGSLKYDLIFKWHRRLKMYILCLEESIATNTQSEHYFVRKTGIASSSVPF